VGLSSPDRTRHNEACEPWRGVLARDIFGLEPEEIEYILGTFPTAEDYETEKFGEFRSRRLAVTLTP
jgi:hypothetical protein